MRLKICTLKWANDDSVREKGGAATANLHCRVFIDDRELPAVVGATATYGPDFATAMVAFCPGSVEIAELDQAEWDALGRAPT